MLSAALKLYFPFIAKIHVVHVCDRERKNPDCMFYKILVLLTNVVPV